MSWEFHVGQKVVCVSDAYSCQWVRRVWRIFRRSTPVLHNLNKGDVYTVTGVARIEATPEPFIGLYVAEARHFGMPVDVPFPSLLFRPLITRKTDISIFKSMLAPQKAREDA